MARKGLNIYKRKDGRWEARYIKSRNTQGKPRYGYLYATSYHKVRNNLQKVIQALNATDNEKVPATNYKFMGFSAIWLENSSTSLKESTYIRYRTLLNCYLMPSFQQLEILPNVIVTSHQAFLTKEALSNIAATTVDNLLKFERGEPSPDTEVCYHCERKETCRKTRDQKCF